MVAVLVAVWITGGLDRGNGRGDDRVETRTASRPETPAEPRVENRTETRADNRVETATEPRRVSDPQLQATLELIERGGPFPHRQDGSTFANRERRLPNQPHGYYREYTVPTPGAKNRGARRVVQGRNGDTWYTTDHYRTFIRLD